MAVRTSSNSSSSQTGARRDAILAYLRERGGRIESPSGVGLTAAIADAVGYGDVGVLNGMLARLEQEGLIDRDIRGRRTFAISLASGGGQTARARGGAPRATATKAASRARGGRRQRGDGLAQAAGALVDQLTALRGALDELSQRVASLEGGGAAPAPAAQAPATKAAAKKSGARKSATRKRAAKKAAAARTTTKRAAAKKTTTKKAAAKKATAAKKTTAAKKSATAKKATATKAPAKRAAAKKAARVAAATRKAGAAKRGAVKKSAARKTTAKRAPARTTAKKASGRKAAAGSGDERSAIRTWARSQGFTVNDRGRVPQNLVDAYRAAQR